jgi:hypothetical protein
MASEVMAKLYHINFMNPKIFFQKNVKKITQTYNCSQVNLLRVLLKKTNENTGAVNIEIPRLG